MKILFIVIDGLGDRSIPELNNKTPLEAAKTPNLDFLVENGICGLAQPFQFPSQNYPSSDVSHLALFGYDPNIYYLGRGPYEAMGVGMKLKQGDVAFRVNFGTVDENLRVIDRRAGRIKNTKSLTDSLKGITIQGVKFQIKSSVEHRAALVLSGKNLSLKVTDGDPKEKGKKVKKILPQSKSRSSQFTALVLNQYLEKTHSILAEHPFNKKRKTRGLFPANYLLIRGAGQFKKTPSFKQKYGYKGACITGGGLYQGIGKILGMKSITQTNLNKKFLKAKKALRNYDFIFCHIKQTDNFSHDGDFQGKKEYIEKIDKNLRPVLNLKNALIVVTADHATCCDVKQHCSEPVPVLIYGDGKDRIKKFSERACQAGTIGKIKGINLIKYLLRFTSPR